MVKVSDSNLDPSTKHDKSDAPSPGVQQIIHDFQDLTRPRETLPPVRDTAHTIPLEPGHKPPVTRSVTILTTIFSIFLAPSNFPARAAEGISYLVRRRGIALGGLDLRLVLNILSKL